MSDGILSDPIDLDEPRRSRSTAKPTNVRIGMELEHRASRTSGTVVRYVQGQRIVLRDRTGRDHSWRPQDGAFWSEGVPVALLKLIADPADAERKFTASGSIAMNDVPARIARASRIYVEGIHDAELIERVWGDDLRIEGIVVEQMQGADDLTQLVAAFRPGPKRRLGVLLDHLVPDSKESRIAAAVQDPNVLICGHPYVDIWEAIRPEAIGLDQWPQVPKGEPWKEGVLRALGRSDEEPGAFWRRAVNSVGSYRDLQTPLITAVEQLIDFVAQTEPEG